MDCLHCGWCCRKLSPLSAPHPCPHIIEKEEDGQVFVFCGIYRKRPDQCVAHDFPTRVCPIGANSLDLPTPEHLRKRIDTGYRLILEMKGIL